MPAFSFVLLYVQNPPASADFYSRLLGQPVIDSSDTFCMLPLREGCMLGLWSRETVAPAPAAMPGSGEIAFTVADRAAVEAEYQAWAARGLTIAQPPIQLDFGHTFVALDPDGNRLRVFAPEAA